MNSYACDRIVDQPVWLIRQSSCVESFDFFLSLSLLFVQLVQNGSLVERRRVI